MEVLLDGLPLGEVSTSMTINSTAAILLALYVAAAEKQGVARDRISGTTQNDILKEYIARGTWIYPPRPSMRLVTDIFEFCAPRAAALEHDLDLAATTCARPERPPPRSSRSRWPTRSPTARRRSPAGSPIDDFAAALSFFFAAWSELFEEVAKFRAARRMWARIVTRPVRVHERAVDGVPVPRPDRRLER